MSAKAPKAQNKPKQTAQDKKQPTATPVSVAKPKEKEEEEELTFYLQPITTLRLFGKVFFRFLGSVFAFIARHFIIFAILFAAVIIPHVIHGAHTPAVKEFDKFAEYCGYWIILGVASSIGLGTGLHTFVLYLGPHIAKFTMAAHEFGSIPNRAPSRWTIRPTFEPSSNTHVDFLSIVLAVQLESFLWGFGTALGELPPYFVAKAASVAGNKNEELENLENSGAEKLVDKAKLFIYKSLKRYGFLTVLLCASIPNPLFDLAGITCGHFGIPLATFLGATIIGKAVIKVHLQMLFVIFIFSAHHIEHVVKFLEGTLPFLKGFNLSGQLEKQKQCLLKPGSCINESKPLVGILWEWIVYAMILYFVYKTIEALAQAELNEENAKKKRK